MITVNDTVSAISKLSSNDLYELKNALYEKFNVKDHESHAQISPVNKIEEIIEEQTSFDIILSDIGSSKLNVIKAIKELTSLGLKESKDLVDATPSNIKTGISIDEANKIKEIIETAGGKVIIK